MKNNILLTGANGRIGSRLLSYLKKKNNVKTLGLNSRNDYTVDLTIRSEVRKFFKGKKFKTIIHCASIVPEYGYKNQLNDWLKNYKMTKNIVDYSFARLIFLSTVKVYSKKANVGFENPAFTKEITSYETSKILSENYIIKKKKNYSIIRLPSIFGENIYSGLVYKLTKCLKKGKMFKIKNSPNQNWSILYIKRLYTIIGILLNKSSMHGIFNAGYKAQIGFDGIFRIICKNFKFKTKNNPYERKFLLDFKKKTFFSKKDLKKDIKFYSKNLIKS